MIAIARAIARRLLPNYRAALAEARRRKAAYDAARAAEETATAAALAAIIGGGVYTSTNERDTFHNGSGCVHVKGRVSHGYGVTLEISNLSAEAARRIRAIIKDEQPVRP